MSSAVSVVIPAYNREASIGAAASSVLRQTHGDLEVIIVDDCSSDGTYARALAIDDPRIRVLRHDSNRGVSAARNTGLRAAAGRYVAFQDSDDEWLPTKLEKQLALLNEDHAAIAAYCGMIIIHDSEAGSRTVTSYVPRRDLTCVDGHIRAALLQTSFISTQTLIVRRTALEQSGGFDETLNALVDWDLVLRLSAMGPIRLVDEPLVLQRFSPNSITLSDKRRVMARMRIVAKHQADLERQPQVLARHLAAIAGGWRRLGDTATARRHAVEAIRTAPLDRSGWSALAATVIDRHKPASGAHD